MNGIVLVYVFWRGGGGGDARKVGGVSWADEDEGDELWC